MYSSKTQNKTKEYVAPSIQQVTLFESKTKQTKKKWTLLVTMWMSVIMVFPM